MSAPDTPNPPPADDFFIGYLGRLPRAIRAPMLLAMLGLLLGFAGGALAIALGQSDPGDGAIFWNEAVKRRGVIVAEPYPHLRLAPDAEAPEGRTHLLIRPGKRGVQDVAAALDGRVVEVSGVWTRRGDIGMIQLNAPIVESADTAPVALAPVTPLGRWRIAGEICDGKCWLGAMRPGVGLAHKACANLCIAGGAPPVLVSSAPVEGETFFLLADPEGGPLDDRFRDLTALPVSLEGALERRGDLLVFKVDLGAAERL